LKQAEIAEALQNAQFCAKIVLKFNKRTRPDQFGDEDIAAAFIAHFINTHRLIRIEENLTENSMIVAKSLLFNHRDADELADKIAGVTQSVEVRPTPEYKLTLSVNDLTCQLALSGGSKILREVFAEFPEVINSHHNDLKACVLSDKGGETVLSLTASSQDPILDFSLNAAKMLGTELDWS
jgi:hypothetical protein